MGGRDTEALLRLIRDSVIGEDHVMETPYGVRRVTYADYTASGRALTLRRGLHPRPGAARLRQHPHRVQRHRPADHPAARGGPARSSASAVGGGDDTVVIFAGSGCTGAIAKLIGVLGLRISVGPRGRPPPHRPHPAGRATGGLPRALRAPLQRDPVARVDRRRGGHPRRTSTGEWTWTSCAPSWRSTPTGR